VSDLLNALSHTPLPTILVLAGILFWVLAVAGSLAGKIEIEKSKQLTAAIVGTAFISLGLILFFFAPKAPEPMPPPAPALSSVTAPSPAATSPSPAATAPPPVTPDEIKICGNATLIELDWQLHDIYQALFKRSDQHQQEQLKREENVWVQQRGRCQSDESCLIATYRSRIIQLH
jgi:uncharacterized protein YecT (DUF1311 family)